MQIKWILLKAFKGLSSNLAQGLVQQTQPYVMMSFSSMTSFTAFLTVTFDLFFDVTTWKTFDKC